MLPVSILAYHIACCQQAFVLECLQCRKTVPYKGNSKRLLNCINYLTAGPWYIRGCCLMLECRYGFRAGAWVGKAFFQKVSGWKTFHNKNPNSVQKRLSYCVVYENRNQIIFPLLLERKNTLKQGWIVCFFTSKIYCAYSNNGKNVKITETQKATQNFLCTKKQRKILLARGLSIQQLLALRCWNVTLLLLLLLQKKCEYHRICCDYLAAAACQDGSAWNKRKKTTTFLSAGRKYRLRFEKKLCTYV